MKHTRFFIRILIIISILLRLGYVIYSSRGSFQFPYWNGYESLKNAYLHSQYIVSNPQGSIPDETLYSYAAGAYLRGESLLDVNPGTPPLGKHMFSLSILLFNNPNVLLIVCMFVFLWGLYALGNWILPTVELSLLAVFFMTFQPLITDQLKYMPLLDLPLIACHVWSVYLFVSSVQNERKIPYILSFFILGMAMVVKIFSISFPLLVIFSIYTIVKNRPLIPAMLLGYGSIMLCFVLSYFPIYSNGYRPSDIVGIQIWSYLYNTSKLNRFFTIWDLIFFNRWHVWWGSADIIRDPNWHISWPIVFGLSFYWIFKQMRNFFRLRVEALIIYIWMVVYFLMISSNQASARYLIPILPFTYIVSIEVVYGWLYTAWKYFTPRPAVRIQ